MDANTDSTSQIKPKPHVEMVNEWHTDHPMQQTAASAISPRAVSRA
jgi:hypothetical protein